MGWNDVVFRPAASPLTGEASAGNGQFYFVHSYFVDPEDHQIVSGTTCYGIEFTSAIACDNVFAVQFHPEKSASDGLRLLQNFVRWNGQVA